MAAVTAAVIAATATVASGAMAASGGMGGGGGGAKQPDIKKIPMDPNDKAMRDYYARLQVANADTRFPSFSEYTQSGGDPNKALMDVNIPDLTPQEAAALKFTGGKGEAVPTVSQQGLASGDITSLNTEQRIFLAKQRAADAAAAGQEPGPWAGRMQKLGGKIGRLENKLENKFYPTPEIEPREQRIEDKLTRLRGTREDVANRGNA